MEKELDAEKGANVQANGSFLYNCYFRTCSDAECTEIKGIGQITTYAGGAVQFDDSCNPHKHMTPAIGYCTHTTMKTDDSK